MGAGAKEGGGVGGGGGGKEEVQELWRGGGERRGRSLEGGGTGAEERHGLEYGEMNECMNVQCTYLYGLYMYLCLQIMKYRNAYFLTKSNAFLRQ